MATSAELLKRHRPFLKYDSQESYFSDSAATWTDNPGNRLLDKNGKELASAGHGLSPAFLGLTYPDGRKADRRDLIANPSKNYREQARKLHENRRYANRMYGHAVVDSNDDLWLQYWFWYFFNDYNLIGNFIKAGLHEGDWEMIQIRLQDETPDLAIYAQHATAETRRWSQVDLVPGTQRPLVYVARGSHAAYFEPGRHWTGHWFDYADAKRKSPEISLNVVVEEDEDWRWIRWPGRWGDTKKGDNPLDSNSPDGPADHDQWDDPLVMVEKAAERPAPPEERPRPPAAPLVRVEWAGSTIRVLYTVQPGPDRRIPRGLAVTINSPEETAPPTTETFTIATRTGSVDLKTATDPAEVLRRLRELRDGSRPGIAERAGRSRPGRLTVRGAGRLPRSSLRQGRGSVRTRAYMRTSWSRPSLKNAPRTVPSIVNPHFSAIRQEAVFAGSSMSTQVGRLLVVAQPQLAPATAPAGGGRILRQRRIVVERAAEQRRGNSPVASRTYQSAR